MFIMIVKIKTKQLKKPKVVKVGVSGKEK